MNPECDAVVIVGLLITNVLLAYAVVLLVYDTLRARKPAEPIITADPAEEGEPWEQDPDEWKKGGE